MFSDKPYFITAKPITSAEANQRLYDIIRERARQDAEFQVLTQNGSQKVSVGSSGKSFANKK